jgi:hypothetical protein
MGRGRAKAKQTKVARELKYHSPSTDLAALQRELTGSKQSDEEFDDYGAVSVDSDDEDDEDDDESGDGSWTPRRR